MNKFSNKSKIDLLTQLLEARKLLRHIKQDVDNGQISDITSDINTYFEKYPGWEEVTLGEYAAEWGTEESNK